MTVSPEEPEVQALLNSLTGVDLYKVMARRREPLLVPHYKLMNMEQLQEVRRILVLLFNYRRSL